MNAKHAATLLDEMQRLDEMVESGREMAVSAAYNTLHYRACHEYADLARSYLALLNGTFLARASNREEV